MVISLKQKIITRLICFIFLISVLINIMPIYAAEERTVIKVGFPHFDGFSEVNDDGTFSGYLYEYLMSISKYTGWKYEFITGDVGDLLTSLIDGEIDIMGGILKTSDTFELINFPEFPSGTAFATLATLTNDKRYNADDYSTFNGMRVAYLDTATKRLNSLQMFCEMNGINITPVPIKNALGPNGEDPLKVALDNGIADACLGADVSLIENTKVIARFAGSPHYFAVSKGKDEILRKLNFAIGKIKDQNVYYDDLLYKKYFSHPEAFEVFLTKEEKEFVEKTKSLKVSVVSDWSPMVYYDQNNKEYQGVAIDILKNISELSNLKIEYVPAIDLAEAMEQVSSGKSDVVAGMLSDFSLSQKYNVAITIPYITTQNMLIARNDVNTNSLASLTIALVSGSSTNEIIGNKIKYYPNIAECVKAVKNGDADYTYCNAYTSEAIIKQHSSRDLIISAIPNRDIQIGFGINNDLNENLITIIEKSINSINAEKLRTIVSRHIIINNSNINMMDYIYTYPVEILCVIILIAFVIVMVLISFIRIRMRHNQAIGGYERSYRLLADTLGEVGFEYNYHNDELILFGKNKHALSSHDVITGFRNKLIQKSLPINFSFEDLNDLLANEEKNENSAVEIQCRMQNGEWTWFRVIYTIVRKDDSLHKHMQILGCLVNIEDERKEKEQLIDMSRNDLLTSLLNRRAGKKAINDYLYQNNCQSQSSLLIIDVDNFKSFNDRFGHLIGDDVLKTLGIILKDVFGDENILCRWGGDEFIVFVPNSDINQLKIQLKILREKAKNHGVDSIPLPISLSMGCSSSSDVTSMETLFQSADEALYRVKNNGRDGFIIDENE